MVKRVILPRDELPHQGQAIEWWYFNGFLNGRKKYAFMTCLFKADTEKVNLKFLKLPSRKIYFSHTLLFDLTTGEIKKEVLPFVFVSDDSFKRKELFVNYMFPVRKVFTNYEIARYGPRLRVKTGFFDLLMSPGKKPLLENQTGFINLGEKTTYYYTYSNLSVEGYIGDDKVAGKAWHDKQWSDKGFMKDSWLWFSVQMPDNTEIVCFDYKGKKLATISYPSGRLKTVEPKFTPLGNVWTSRRTGLKYRLAWEINAGEFTIKTRPMLKDCEMNFGTINYWEGPLEVAVNGKKAIGFMEYLAEQKPLRRVKIMGEEFVSRRMADLRKISKGLGIKQRL